MGKIIMTLGMMFVYLPAFGATSPSGQQTCHGVAYGKTFTFQYGLFANSGEAKLTIVEKGKSPTVFDLDGNNSGDESQNLTYTAKAGQGFISWIGGGDHGVNAAFVTVKVDSDNSYQLVLPCKTTSYHKDPMAN